MKALQAFLFVLTSFSLSVVVTELIHATNGNFSGFSGFGQRYGANSYITTQPLYFKEIDEHGRIIRADDRFITAPTVCDRQDDENQSYQYSPYTPSQAQPINEQSQQVINPRKAREDYYYNYAKRFRNNLAFGRFFRR